MKKIYSLIMLLIALCSTFAATYMQVEQIDNSIFKFDVDDLNPVSVKQDESANNDIIKVTGPLFEEVLFSTSKIKKIEFESYNKDKEPVVFDKSNGVLPGVFSVSETRKVHFASGNLILSLPDNTFRFAENQYDKIGTDNKNFFANNPEGSFDLIQFRTMESKIELEHWDCLSQDEWKYLLEERDNAQNMQGQATVNGVTGLILLPDNWKLPDGIDFVTNPKNYTTNVYSVSEWNKLEIAGAVFFPAAGECTTKNKVPTLDKDSTQGTYWTSTTWTKDASDAGHVFFFRSDFSGSNAMYDKKFGLSVRLVTDIESVYRVNFYTEDSLLISSQSVKKNGSATPVEVPAKEGEKPLGWSESYSNVTSSRALYPVYGEEIKLSESDSSNGYIYVDLGLSVKWATCNLGASKPTEIGDYYSWGETATRDTFSWKRYKWCEGKKFDSWQTPTDFTKYVNLETIGIVDSLRILEPEDDAATVNMGKGWRMPLTKEITELIEKCTWEWTNNFNGSGVAGFIATSTINGNKIFIPKSGAKINLDFDSSFNDYCTFWSSTVTTSYATGFYSKDKKVVSTIVPRFYGMPIRAVYDTRETFTINFYDEDGTLLSSQKAKFGETPQGPYIIKEGQVFVGWSESVDSVKSNMDVFPIFREPTEEEIVNGVTINGQHNGYNYVDLGLPSGMLWATCNVGASLSFEDGDYFAWAETEPKNSYTWDNYKWCEFKLTDKNGNPKDFSKYCNSKDYGILDEKTKIESEDDAASVNMKGNWSLPSYNDVSEILLNCTIQEVYDFNDSGISGYLLKSKNNGNTIFFPTSGYYNGDDFVEDFGYWVNSKSSISDNIGLSLIYSSLWEEISIGYNINRYYGLPVRAVVNKNNLK